VPGPIEREMGRVIVSYDVGNLQCGLHFGHAPWKRRLAEIGTSPPSRRYSS
jgi:hypothetical protein